jgi:alginate O-acetyltransferase complex protein AlgI
MVITQWGWWLFILLGPVVYWRLPQGWRPTALAAASMVIIGSFAALAVGLMFTLTLLAWYAHERPEWFGAVAGPVVRSPWPIAVILACLLWSKYLPEFAMALRGHGGPLDFVAPLGLSYFAFKMIHYIVERRRGNFPPHDLSDLMSYVFFGPIFTAGPIERFEHFLAHRETSFHIDQVVEGGTRIAFGIVKKFWAFPIVIAGFKTVSGGDFPRFLSHLDAASPLSIWALLFLALASAYLDFSGYSDMAIGAGRLFGLRILENFNYPFLATNLRDFWLRWHMTLALWCRVYVYMPLIGLTRNPYGAVFAAFAVMGAWHAGWPPQWVLWGMWHGIGSVIVLMWSRFAMKRKIKIFKGRGGAALGWAVTMGYVALGGAFTLLYGQSAVTDSFRLMARALGATV